MREGYVSSFNCSVSTLEHVRQLNLSKLGSYLSTKYQWTSVPSLPSCSVELPDPRPRGDDSNSVL